MCTTRSLENKTLDIFKILAGL